MKDIEELNFEEKIQLTLALLMCDSVEIAKGVCKEMGVDYKSVIDSELEKNWIR